MTTITQSLQSEVKDYIKTMGIACNSERFFMADEYCGTINGNLVALYFDESITLFVMGKTCEITNMNQLESILTAL